MNWDTLTMGSMYSNKRSHRLSKSHISISSEEHMVHHELPTLGNGINVTREVNISYETSDTPFVHAALVGLIQGMIGAVLVIR